MAKARQISNADHIKQVELEKRIKIEQTFANQAYADFKGKKFGIASCCYTDFFKCIIKKRIM